jgi:tagatose 6-phosphate kinase
MIFCIGATPAVQRVMVFRQLVPDAVNRATTTLDGAAGKSINVAKVLQTFGEEPLATGFLGGDRGQFLRSVLENKGIRSDFVAVAPRTRQCITVIDESGGTITELVEESQPVAPEDYEKLVATVRLHVSQSASSGAPACRAVVMSGTVTPGGPIDFYRQCTEMAHEVRALSIVDAHGPTLLEALKAGPGLVKPNRAELAAMVGRNFKDDAAVASTMRDLHQLGSQRIVVTAGTDPVLAFDGRTLWRIQSPRIRALNPIGSGDAFTAGLVSRLARGDDLGEACCWAAATGAANALTLMPGELNLQDVDRLMREVTLERVSPA